MAAIDLSVLDNLRQNLAKLRGPVQTFAPTEALPYPTYTLSNMGLLLRTLITFFSKTDTARYLPHSITFRVASLINEIDNAVSTFPSGADDPTAAQAIEGLPSLLQKMDDLYALCLQYGLISFGFDAKVAKEHVDSIRDYASQAESAMADARALIEAAIKNVNEQTEAALAAIPAKLEEYQASLKQVLDNTQELAATAQHRLDEIATAGQLAATEITNIQSSSAGAVEANTKLAGLAQSAAEHHKKVVEEGEATRTAAQAAERQTSQFAADAKAAHKELTDTKAAIDVQFKKITEFYGDIEKHQQDMLTVKKDATSMATSLKESTDNTLQTLSTRTDAIVRTNEALIDQIKDHLTKAVGISLFKAFGNRQFWLAMRVYGWGTLLLAGTAGAATLAYLFANSVATTEVKSTVFIARLLIAIPAAFLIGFVARQYARERRAEEEYAFKSAISVSLESYRDLVVKMRKDGSDIEAEFVKELIRDIFDNPTKRLYPAQLDYDSLDGKVKQIPEGV